MAIETFKEDFEREFGTLTAKQLWILVRFAKHVRLRARNNTAFNNFCNRTFPNATFRQITKTKSNGETYQGLSLVVEGEEFSPEIPGEEE
jgi:hypothetical protein